MIQKKFATPYKWVVALPVMLTLVACGTTGRLPSTDQADKRDIWQHRKNRLSGISDWKLAGRIGVILKDDAGSATLLWEQHPEAFSIKLVAPLGKGLFNITGDENTVSLTDEDGMITTADSAEALIRQHTGWPIPVEGLQKWAIGLVDDKYESDFKLDDEGRLKSLKVAGWKINYLQYTKQSDIELPKKITMKNNEITLKLSIRRWEIQ